MGTKLLTDVGKSSPIELKDDTVIVVPTAHGRVRHVLNLLDAIRSGKEGD